MITWDIARSHDGTFTLRGSAGQGILAWDDLSDADLAALRRTLDALAPEPEALSDCPRCGSI